MGLTAAISDTEWFSIKRKTKRLTSDISKILFTVEVIIFHQSWVELEKFYFKCAVGDLILFPVPRFPINSFKQKINPPRSIYHAEFNKYTEFYLNSLQTQSRKYRTSNLPIFTSICISGTSLAGPARIHFFVKIGKFGTPILWLVSDGLLYMESSQIY